MRPIVILSALIASISAPPLLSAQTLGQPIPGQRSDVTPSQLPAGRAKSVSRARPCPEYGPGFVRLEGSTTCMRAGGKVIYEYGVTSGRRTEIAPSTGSRSAFVSELETRTPTDAGPFRMVVRGVVVRETGSAFGSPLR
ncbi:MAG: hypothetical protein ACRCXM_08500 [Beijerinckiaceae bacterium]